MTTQETSGVINLFIRPGNFSFIWNIFIGHRWQIDLKAMEITNTDIGYTIWQNTTTDPMIHAWQLSTLWAIFLSTTINRGKSGGHYLILLLNSLNLVLHLMFNAFHPSLVNPWNNYGITSFPNIVDDIREQSSWLHYCLKVLVNSRARGQS